MELRMPYCSKCGNTVDASDVYCARCGARQPVEPPRRVAADPFAGMTPRTASILCYIPVVGWIAAIVVLASEKFRNNRNVRFHAFQGLYLFVGWLIVDQVLRPMLRAIHGPILPLDVLLKTAILVISIFMIIKASQEEAYSLPIIGELAERSLSEKP
jgi:uncharacterized membrane protein